MLPGLVVSLESVVGAMACGWYHTLVAGHSTKLQPELRSASSTFGSMHGWGSSAWGQLGTGDLTNVGTPTAVTLPVEPAQLADGSLRAATPLCTAVACGGGHSLALTEDVQRPLQGNLSMRRCTSRRCVRPLNPYILEGCPRQENAGQCLARIEA